jgi:hypothetical protein
VAVAAVTKIREGLDDLLSTDYTSFSKTELPALADDLEAQLRRSGAVDHLLIFEMSERGTAGDYGRTSPVDLLVDRLRISPGEAKGRLNRARDLGARRAYTGERLAPVLSLVSAAVNAGEISRSMLGRSFGRSTGSRTATRPGTPRSWKTLW